MEEDIKKLDAKLDEIISRPLRGISQFLVTNFDSDDLHIMQRLARQRMTKREMSQESRKYYNHLVAILGLAHSVKKVI